MSERRTCEYSLLEYLDALCENAVDLHAEYFALEAFWKSNQGNLTNLNQLPEHCKSAYMEKRLSLFRQYLEELEYLLNYFPKTCLSGLLELIRENRDKPPATLPEDVWDMLRNGLSYDEYIAGGRK